MNIQVGDIGHIIQLAIAPVFLLTGVCTNLMVLTNRLARIIDRSRVLEDRLDIGYNEAYMGELDTLYQRSHLINYSITLSTACGLLICLVIAMLFTGDTMNITLDKYIAAFFVVAMLALIGSFGYLLSEIFIASKAMRTRRHVRIQS
jgi:archaellum biogenesis protein FlaJ (TadC family)